MKDQIEVLSIAEGFYQSSVLFALLRLKVFQRIGELNKTLDDLAHELEARPETLKRLLNAGVMLKLLETDDEEAYRLSPVCRSVLLPNSTNEAYLGNWLQLLDEFQDASSRLDEAVLKSAPTVDPSTYLGRDRARTRTYTLAMHSYAAMRGKELAHYLDTSSCKAMLDLGCGPGTFAFHLGLCNPNLRLHLSDLPEVLEVARDVQTRYPLQNEITYLPLDASRDEISGSYDLVLASNMLQCFEGSTRSELLRRIYRALNPGGSLVVQAQFLQENRQASRWAVYVDLNLLCTTQHGRNHTVEETRRWLQEAGLINVEYCPMSVYGTTSFLRGFKHD